MQNWSVDGRVCLVQKKMIEQAKQEEIVQVYSVNDMQATIEAYEEMEDRYWAGVYRYLQYKFRRINTDLVYKGRQV